jgi:iron(III) transport system ATP-binding protein
MDMAGSLLGPPAELFGSPHAFVADFLAEANIVDGQLLAVAGETGDVEIGGHVVRLPHRGHAVGKVAVAIRPDAIGLHLSDGSRGIAGTISRAAFVGRVVEYAVETAAGELLAIVPGVETALSPGTRVSLYPSPRGVALVE